MLHQLRLEMKCCSHKKDGDCDLKERERDNQDGIINRMKLQISFKVVIFGSQTVALLRGLSVKKARICPNYHFINKQTLISHNNVP